MAFDTVEVDSGSYTPESLKLRRRLAEAMMQQGMQTGPIGSHWQGLARIAQAMMGGYQLGELERQEKAGQDSGNEALLGLLGGGRGSPVAEAAPSGAVGAASSFASPGASVASPAAMGDIEMHKRAIAGVETGGEKDPYRALGPIIPKTGDRAYGKYQVMGENIGPWTREILGRELTPQQYLADEAAQEKVFEGKFGSYLAKTGSPQDAASMWFTGKPAAQGAGRNDGYTSQPEYLRRYTAGLGQPQEAGAAPAQAPQSLPPVGAQAESFLDRLGLTPQQQKSFYAAYSNPATKAQALQLLGLVQKQKKPYETLAPNATVYDPNTNRAIFTAPGAVEKPKASDVAGVRKEYTAASQDYVKQLRGADSVRVGAQSDSPQGDMAIVYGFMKMLDPNSVVRETEYATAENAASIPERIRVMYNKAKDGERLTPEMRNKFLDQAEQQLSVATARHEERNKLYKGIAERAGYDPADIVTEYAPPKAFRPDMPQPDQDQPKPVKTTRIDPATGQPMAEPQQASQASPQTEDPIARAAAAIQAGAPKEAVIQRLQQAGIDPAPLLQLLQPPAQAPAPDGSFYGEGLY